VSAVSAKISEVVLVDPSESQRKKSLEFVQQLLKKDEAKGKLTASDSLSALSRLRYLSPSSLSGERRADFIVEAATEEEKTKNSIIKSLAPLLHPATIVASNTSSLSITALAASLPTENQQNFIGMHFMNPVPVMKLIEIIPGLHTSDATIKTTVALAMKMGKTVTQSKDQPGFIANRLLMPYINEAIMALQEGIATKEDIDTTMKLGTGVPMGPLQLADFIGLDTCLSIMKVLHVGFGDSKYRPAVLLGQMVAAGNLGRKSGRGFYAYSN